MMMTVALGSVGFQKKTTVKGINMVIKAMVLKMLFFIRCIPLSYFI